MLERLGLPRPQIATKLYGAIALALAVVYLLGAATIQFAGRTEEVAGWIREEGLQRVVLAQEAEASLEQQRGLVKAAAFAREHDAIERDERTYRDRTAKFAALMPRMGYRPTHSFAERFAALEQQGALAFGFARLQLPEQARAAAAQFAAAAEGLQRDLATERQHRMQALDAALLNIAASSRSLIAWVCAAAVTGLLIGPMGLLLLRRVLGRLQGIGWALLRLARHDTSIDIPGLAQQDELGQLARSVAVFKAKSLELLHKKDELRAAQSPARRRHQHHAAGPEHVRRPGAPAGVQQALRRDVRPARAADAARHGALRAVGPPREAGRQALPVGGREIRARGRLPRVHDHRVRQRARHRRGHAAAQGRRLGGARRGHHPAPPPGARHHPSGAPRCLDRACQPLAVPGAAAAGAAAPGARQGLCRAVPRSRSLQERQRYARAIRSAMRC